MAQPSETNLRHSSKSLYISKYDLTGNLVNVKQIPEQEAL